MLVAGGAANSVIIFHAESVKVPVNCTLTSASELEAALPKELLPISALGKRIHHCRPQETAKSFPELLAAKSPCPPSSFLFFLFFPPSEGEVRAGARLFLCSGAGRAGRQLLWRAAQCPWVCVPTPAGQCCAPSPWHFSPCTSWAWELCPRSWKGHPGLSSVSGALQALVSSGG